MAKDKKRQIREAFQHAVLGRDKGKCVLCKVLGKDTLAVDAHHITDRSLMPNGGYVKENGISVCVECHLQAEQFHITGTAVAGYSPEDLYHLIGSSYEVAVATSERLG